MLGQQVQGGFVTNCSRSYLDKYGSYIQRFNYIITGVESCFGSSGAVIRALLKPCLNSLLGQKKKNLKQIADAVEIVRSKETT